MKWFNHGNECEAPKIDKDIIENSVVEDGADQEQVKALQA